MKSPIPVRQPGTFETGLHISAATGQGPKRIDAGRLCYADFFTMFGLPFRYGSAWTPEADEKAEQVVVIDSELNQRFFGGENSVGRMVRVEGRDFRVVGVLAPFRPSLRYYDLSASAPTSRPEKLFIPMSHILPMEIGTAAAALGWGGVKGQGFTSYLHAEYNFLQMWVELDNPADVDAYKNFLDAYAMEQRKLGRFQRPLDNRVTPLLDYMRERKCPPPEITAMMLTANLFLVACALSLMGLLLSRFLARAGEVGVRRALGARRLDVFWEHVIECEIVALVGGLLGLAIAAASLRPVNGWYATHVQGLRDDALRMDSTMAFFALGIALVAGLLAGVYPALRVSRVAPAAHLKTQ